MSSLILGKRIVDIIGGHQINPQVLMQPHQTGIHHLLLGNPMVLQFQKEIVRSENPSVFFRRGPGLLIHSPDQKSGNFPGQTGAQGDYAFMVLFQRLIVHPGFIIKSFRKPFGYNFHQIVIARIIFSQQHHMVIAVFPGNILPVKPGPGRHIDLTADNRLNSRIFTGTVKVDHAVHHAMVRNRQTVHSQRLRLGRQLRNLAGTVQQAVFRMHMQMCKRHFFLLCNK